jgi:hypothetical protein
MPRWQASVIAVLEQNLKEDFPLLYGGENLVG